MTYYAKSADESGYQPTNQEHLQAVANLAEQFGSEVGMPTSGRAAGLLHDFGKYSGSFQDVLRGTVSGVDHAICAAAFLYAAKAQKSIPYRRVAAVAAAHHGVLRSYSTLEPELYDLCLGRGSGVCQSGKKAALFGPEAYLAAQQAFLQDFPDFRFHKLESFPGETQTEAMLRMRMLFSCLVDADYTASAGRNAAESAPLPAQQLLQVLDRHMAALRAGSRADQGVNRLRDEVFRLCGEAGAQPPGLFTLTAPTGVGKTLSLLHFALRHCAAHGRRRIILVLPFLTLTEQSQREYEKLIPNILADHSQSRLSQEVRELAARWDAPFIITTSVRFFEGLFSCHPKDCRKLHSIAQSVILFDEAQSLPADLATATMRTAAALCRDYGCTMVFSTATQPDFAALPGLPDWMPREILPDGERYYAALRRTRVDWRLDCPTPLADIAGEMARQTSVCAIVNLRRHAAQLFSLLKAVCPPAEQDGLFFLTTDLCPAHRSDVIDAIKARLRAHRPCRVVATQCIEAGVDLDFETMYRALAPLEAIIQAAGRCNRNGMASGDGKVTVFIPEDDRNIYPGDSYRKGAEIVKLLYAEGGLDIHDPASIRAYYRRLFQNTKDKIELSKAIDSEAYEAAEQAYKLIRNHGVQVIVPYPYQGDGDTEPLFERICRQARRDGVTPALIRQAAPITVSCYHEDPVRQHCEQIPLRKRHSGERAESDLYLLATGHEDCYQPDTGLRLAAPSPADEIFLC